MEDLTGKQFGPYQIVAPLGEGGMAAVYKAYQPAVERYVALKVLPRHFADDAQFVARFQREAKLLAQLQHPHILPVFDYGQAEGYTYIVMPFVQSGTLTDLLKGQPLPLPRIRQVISQVGDALNYAHARGLIHRDVKPSNILIDESGNCLLTDFGLARMVEASVNLTTAGTIMGTPAYMSPEQGSGKKVVARSDIYSLGVILYEMATGRVPYRAETPIAVVFKHIQDPLPPARALNPELPEAVELVILKALSKNPEGRYQTADDMVRAVQVAISDITQAPIPTETSSPGEAQTKTLVRKSGKASLPKWAYVVGVFALIGLLVVMMGRGAPNTAVTGAVTQTAADTPVPPTITAQPTTQEKNADPTVYDDFNNPAFDGKINTSLWSSVVKSPSYIEQRGGLLVVSLEPRAEKTTTLFATKKLKSNQYNFIESRILLSSERTGQEGEIGFAMMTIVKNGRDLIYLCVIGRYAPIQVWCEVYGRTDPGPEYKTGTIITNYDVWHTVRIEMDPEINATFYVDGQQVGSYRPNDAEEIKGRDFTVRLEIWSPMQTGIQAHFDDVRVGQFRKQ